jgi:hypothetical protein
MPADLYLRSTIQTLAQTETERDRFIDSYDKYSLLKLLGLSWQRDVLPMLDKKDCLPVAAAGKFLTLLEGHEITAALVDDWYRAAKLERPVEEWLHYFQEQRRYLIYLLAKSVEVNEPLQCNL